jgi:hypothetical protein
MQRPQIPDEQKDSLILQRGIYADINKYGEEGGLFFRQYNPYHPPPQSKISVFHFFINCPSLPLTLSALLKKNKH